MARIFYVVEVHGDYTQANFFKTDKEALAYGIGEFPDFDMYDEPMEDEENEVWISGDKLEFKKDSYSHLKMDTGQLMKQMMLAQKGS